MGNNVWTKDAELDQLKKIKALIEETEPGSYIRMAFAGCVAMAEKNIALDYGDSYPDIIDRKDVEISEYKIRIKSMQDRINDLSQQVKDAREYRESTESVIDKMDDEITKWKNSYCDAVAECRERQKEAAEMYAELDKECGEKDVEIMRLKAEIYDLRKEMEK